MSRRVSLPKIDPRRADDLFRQLRRMAPHYTSEWTAKDNDDPGVALLKIFSFVVEGVISRLNKAPDRNFLAFLDMLGIRLLPATPARVPVTFLPAKGTVEPFLVPRGTQVLAPATAEREEEMPFETMVDLWAIPAKLAELIAVDPEKDRIYKPPPQFLVAGTAASELPSLRVTAFSAANSKFLQLDPPKQVKEGDFLRIEQALAQVSRDCLPVTDPGQSRVVDHLEVLSERGSIVTVVDPLPRDYSEGTEVQRVTQFELFEAKNWQEHVLYLAHDKYFAIKSEAQIELRIELAPGASANLPVLDVVWEFFGVTETVKEEGWHRFDVDVDGTQGFSRNGRVILIMPPGEINETEVNGNKSRWIRARLDEPLPATPSRPLPRIESITLAVSYTGEDLVVDQAFHNDTPLTTDVPFFPFGTEPRIFDRFSIASEEAFSKLGAEIKLEFTLDTSDLLGPPAGILVNGASRIFVRAAGGKLLEFNIVPEPPSTTTPKHLNPKDTRISAGITPAVVHVAVSGVDRIGVFVRAEDGQIHLCEIATPSIWHSLQSPPGELQFDPAAITIGGQWQVFVVADNQLFSTLVNPSAPGTVVTWTRHASPFQVASTPHAIVIGSSFAVGVTDVDGHTWIFNGAWKDHTPKRNPPADVTPLPDFLAAKNARPFLRSYSVANNTHVRIFLRSKNNALVVFDTEDNAHARSLGPPTGTVGVDSNPFAVESGGREVVYVRGSDNRLWETENSISPTWNAQENPSDFSLAGDPVALTSITGSNENLDLISVFSTTDKNSLLEFRVRRTDGHSSTLRAGPLEIVILADPLGAGTHFIRITTGPGSTSSNSAVREIDSALSAGRFAVLKDPLDAAATAGPDGTKYDLFRLRASGSIRSVTSTQNQTLIELQSTANPAKKQFLFAAGELREIVDVTGNTAVFDLWTTPESGDEYKLLSREGAENREVPESAGDRALLETTASDVPDRYEGLRLEITSGPGASPVGKLIRRYFSVTKAVIVSEAFPQPPPQRGSGYRVASAASLFVYADPDQTDLRPELSWEYWNGRGWVALRLEKETTEKFLVTGNVSFRVPEDIAKTEVGGQENYWIRTRIVGGDYGRELFEVNQRNQITIKKDPIRPPKIMKLALRYKLTEMKDPQFCVTFNNLNYLDQTAANTTEDKHFQPYITLSDTNKAVYFGFDQAFDSGPVRIYFAAKELEVDELNKPKLAWEFAFDNDWKAVFADDDTEAFTKPEFVSLTVSKGFQNTQQFGKPLYWLRATLSEGSWPISPLFRGVFVNTVSALQARTVLDEILGSSTGVANQKFQFQHTPIIEGEQIRVREALTDLEREQLVSELGKDAVLVIQDEQGRVIETWIRWREVLEFFDSGPNSRHYRLDRQTGELEFGDGVRGRFPPPGGDNIRAFAYQEGGGAAGNVEPGEIKSLVTAVAGVDKVINPVAAGGGSEAATNEDMLVIGPEQISNRGRAVTPDDFEQLAREASREVRKALCLPNRNASGRHERGWTSVHIVPDSKDAAPVPSLELRRAVQRYLEARADVSIVDQKRIFVGPPSYVPVSVEVTVFARSLDVVSRAEQNVRAKLDKFLHPLTGGFAGEGWDFGRNLAASDLYTLLEDIDDVDHVGPLRLLFGDQQSNEEVDVEPNALLASGVHEITMDVATGD